MKAEKKKQIRERMTYGDYVAHSQAPWFNGVVNLNNIVRTLAILPLVYLSIRAGGVVAFLGVIVGLSVVGDWKLNYMMIKDTRVIRTKTQQILRATEIQRRIEEEMG